MDQPPGADNRSAGRLRLLVLVFIACAALDSAQWLHITNAGHRLRGHQVRAWVQTHRLIAPLALVGMYVVLATLALPVWEVQVAAGFCFGLVAGVWWSEVGAALGGLCAYAMSRWLAGTWFRARVEARMPDLARLTARLGHNGFAVVMACRLLHFVPFGLSNYAFGLVGISAADVAFGSFLGNIPTATLCAGAGAGYRPWHNPRFILMWAAINVLLLIPVALRYWRPQWFKKIGVE